MNASEHQNLQELIREHILKSSNGPGSRIETEVQLSKRFNVSRYHIRNVLNGLVQQGIITKTPRRGTFINKFDTDTISNNLKFSYEVSDFNLYESIEARIVVELATLPLVVQRIKPVEISKLEGIIDKMLKNKNEPMKADEADMEFHAVLLKASGNQLLNSFSIIISRIFQQSEYRSKYWNTDTIEKLAMEHRSILVAIQDGDIELATIRLKSHLHYTKKIEWNEVRNGQIGNSNLLNKN